MLVAGGDAVLSEQEREAFVELGRRLSGTEDMEPEFEAFDWETATLEDTLPQGMITRWKHVAIYEAIKVASADGDLHDEERARVQRAAEALGVHSSTVLTLEALAAEEKALRERRLELFQEL